VRLPLRAKRTTHNNARAGGGWVGGEKGMTGMMNGALPAKALCGRFAGALRASLRGGGDEPQRHRKPKPALLAVWNGVALKRTKRPGNDVASKRFSKPPR
jgi:hypothetical protein